MAEHAPDLGQADLEAGQPRSSSSGKSMMRSGASALPATVIADGSPPQRSSTMRVASSSPGTMKAGIDAALEAIARVRIDAELAAGLRDVERVPQRRFDQHVGGGLRRSRCLAAHDAGERLDALLVGDHAHGLVERVGLAVEREQRFRRSGRGAP